MKSIKRAQVLIFFICLCITGRAFATLSILELFESNNKKKVLEELSAIKGDKPTLKKLVNTADFLGNTPLHIAAEKGWSLVAEQLIKMGAEIDPVEKVCDETPFLTAVKNFRLMPEDMVSRRAYAANSKWFKENPLGHEYFLPTVELSTVLKNNNLCKAWEVYLALQEKNMRDAIKKVDAIQTRALSRKSSKNPYFRLIKLLLENGAGMNEQDKLGNSVLHYAIWYSMPLPVVAYLIKNGADVKLKNNIGCTPIHYVKEHKKTDHLDLLMKNGADINAQNNNKETILHLLVEWLNTSYNHASLAVFNKILAAYKPDLELTQKSGLTALALVNKMPESKQSDALRVKISPLCKTKLIKESPKPLLKRKRFEELDWFKSDIFRY